MKTLIVYSSKSGNTKKLAEAIYGFLPGENTLKPVEEAPDPAGYDLIIAGFWLQGGKADSLSSQYLATLDSVKLFLFATHGAAVDSDHAENGMQSAKTLAQPCDIVGEFHCQGEVKAEFLAKVQAQNPQPPWVKDAPNAVGHPSESDISRLQDVLHDTIEKISV